jgi:hypothetical protein
LIVEGVLSFIGTDTYLEQGLPVEDVELADCNKGVNLPLVELATPEYVTC